MSERRFVICETGEAWNGELGKEVTESELKRRLREIIYANWNEEACIDILLHGEEEQPPAGLFHGPGLPIRDMV